MSSHGRRMLMIGLMITLSFGASISYAQQVFGSIYGTVTDPSGSPVNNAKVTISDVTKGTSSEVMTNESGNYTKGQLIPDTYKVTIEAPGFNKVVSNDIPVQVDQASQFSAAMQVGSVDTSVEVTASAPLLQSDRADVAQTFTAQQISQLPRSRWRLSPRQNAAFIVALYSTAIAVGSSITLAKVDRKQLLEYLQEVSRPGR